MNSLCKICNLEHSNVKYLPCGHAFCEQCIREFITSRTYDFYGVFPCPVCQTSINIPLGGVANFYSSLMFQMESGAISQSSNDNCFLSDPISISISKQDLLIITDRKDNRVFIYNELGYLQAVFSCKENINCAVESPRGSILLTSSNEMLPLILEFDMLGKRIPYITTLAKYESSHGICLLSDPDEIVVSCPQTFCLYFFTPSGKMIKRIGGKSLIGSPFFMASSLKLIAFTDAKNHKIKVLKRNGKILWEMGGLGTNESQLFEPKGLCIVDESMLLVADYGNRCLKCFDLNSGHFHGIIASFDEELLRPKDLVYSEKTEMLFVLLIGQNKAFIRPIKFSKVNFKQPGIINCINIS